jgi:SAM-dependent methyltransferase
MPWFKKKENAKNNSSYEKHGNRTSHEQPLSGQSVYMLPKDFREVNRLDFQHYLLKQAISGNYLAPLQQPSTILDVACGTGRWMLEMAHEFPQANITGVDITPLETSTITFPPNCHFRQCDIFKGLPFPSGSFDFVHQRFLIFALPVKQWPVVLRELRRVTLAGQWIEVTDPDLTFTNQGLQTTRLMNWISQASAKRGLDITIGSKLGSFMQAAGLRNVSVGKVPVPLGAWGGRMGSFLIKDFYGAALTLKPLVIASTDATSDEYDRVVADWVRECDENHSSCDFYIAYGQS